MPDVTCGRVAPGLLNGTPMRLVGQLFLAATAIAAANGGCDRHTQPSPRSLADEAEANLRQCAQQVMTLISLAFGPAMSTPGAAAATATADKPSS